MRHHFRLPDSSASQKEKDDNSDPFQWLHFLYYLLKLSATLSRLLSFLPYSSSSSDQFFFDHMLLSRFAIPLIVSCFLALDYVLPVSGTAAEDAVPHSSAACSNCNICPYPCHPLPPPPPAAPAYGAPPPPLSPPVQGGNCQPGGQVVPSPPANTYPYGYAPPTPPLGYTPIESRSALSLSPSLLGCLVMLLLLSLCLSI